MANDKNQDVWLAAYNAALTGILAAGATVARKAEIHDACVQAADRSLADFEKRWPPAPPSTKAALGLGA